MPVTAPARPPRPIGIGAALPAFAVLFTAAAMLVSAPRASAATIGATETAAVEQGCGSPIGVAHRGRNGDNPENSLAGFRSSIRAGATALETDVQFSSDSVPVLMHDTTLDRTTNGSGAVHDHTADALRRIKLSNGEPVPLLADLLTLAESGRATLLLETKEWLTPTTMASLAAVLAAHPGVKINLNSHHRQDVIDMGKQIPGVSIGWLNRDSNNIDPSWVPAGAYLLKEADGVTGDRVDRWRGAGHKVVTWTPNTESDWRFMARAGVDFVITDRIGAYLNWARQRCRPAPVQSLIQERSSRGRGHRIVVAWKRPKGWTSAAAYEVRARGNGRAWTHTTRSTRVVLPRGVRSPIRVSVTVQRNGRHSTVRSVRITAGHR